MRIAVLMAVVACFVGGCSYVNDQLGMKSDWFGEEILEDVIESQVGLDLDLTPGSKE